VTENLKKIFPGFGSIIDINPEPVDTPHVKPVDSRSDAQKIAGDWVNIGGDLSIALNKYIKNESQEK